MREAERDMIAVVAFVYGVVYGMRERERAKEHVAQRIIKRER